MGNKNALKLFTAALLGSMKLKRRVVMAPLLSAPQLNATENPSKIKCKRTPLCANAFPGWKSLKARQYWASTDCGSALSESAA